MNTLAAELIDIITTTTNNISYNTAETIAHAIVNATRSWHPQVRREARLLVRAIRTKTVNKSILLEYAEA